MPKMMRYFFDKMIISLRAKVKKSFNILIKAFIVLAAYGFLYYQLFHKDKLNNVVEALGNYADKPEVWQVLAFVLVLMVVNWSIEAIKWRYLLKKEEAIGFLKSLKACRHDGKYYALIVWGSSSGGCLSCERPIHGAPYLLPL
ncbi:MAG: hypothetical protein U5L09_13780 [Bacteroidales bacterium]|nr:hypothetical protein [Bacteroidales bacterium]